MRLGVASRSIWLQVIRIYGTLIFLTLAPILMAVTSSSPDSGSSDHPPPRHHRHKRFVWMKDRKLIMPPGSSLIVTPKLQIPFIRQPPEGVNSDIQISWPFYLFFDGLGMTHIDHPWPPPLFFPFTDLFYNSSFLGTHNKSDKNGEGNDTSTKPPKKGSGSKARSGRASSSVLSLPPPEELHGGERAILLPRLESILASFGINGRSCLLRIICEVHEYPLGEGYGLFGEFVTLFFSISSSSYAESHLPEYLKAELAGKYGEDGCRAYHKACPKSIFVWEDKVRPSQYRYKAPDPSPHHHDLNSNNI